MDQFRNSAAQEVQQSIDPRYFEALQSHPRMLVGTEVPSLKGEGMERLKDTQDAREWQEATASLLTNEINSLASSKADSVRPMMSVIQESVLMFQNNPDLVPGTSAYDEDLAAVFTEIAQAYELRVNGKLYGYQVPVQPLINQIRQALAEERGAAGVPTPAPSAALQPRNAAGQFDSPQAGIASKAGMSGGEGDDYSTFWGAVGMPNVTI